MNAGLLIIILLLGLSFLGFPIYLALGIGALAALNLADLPLIVLPQRMFAGMNSSALLAIPFFILAGNIMSRSITGKLIDICNAIIGHIKGSLALVTILASALFGAISGSGVATASAIGGITIPAMKREGYPAPFAVGVASISSILGPIIPPSIVLIVYASITNVSVAELFLGSVLPGIILAVCLIAYGLYYGHKHNLPAHEKPNLKKIGTSVRKGIWALLMPIIILGGIFGGIFTPTEAAAVSAVYGLIVGVFIYRKMRFGEFIRCIVDSMAQNGQVLFVMICAALFAWMVAATGMTTTIGNALISLSSGNLIIFLLITNLILLFAGCIMDANSALYILVPILLPVAQELGYDSVAFGILMCVNLAIGLITPPVGVNLYTACSIAKISLRDIIKWVLPLIGFLLIVLLLVTYIPQISLFLPSLMS